MSVLLYSKNCSLSLNLRSKSFRSRLSSVVLALGVGQNLSPNLRIFISSLESSKEERLITLGFGLFRSGFFPGDIFLKKVVYSCDYQRYCCILVFRWCFGIPFVGDCYFCCGCWNDSYSYRDFQCLCSGWCSGVDNYFRVCRCY